MLKSAVQKYIRFIELKENQGNKKIISDLYLFYIYIHHYLSVLYLIILNFTQIILEKKKYGKFQRSWLILNLYKFYEISKVENNWKNKQYEY